MACYSIKLKKITRPNIRIPFDYNLLNFLLKEVFMVCPTTFIAKCRNSGEPLLTDLGYKGIHSNKPTNPILGRFPVLFCTFFDMYG